MSKRSRKRRALPSGAPSWPVGFGPGEPHGPGDDFPIDVLPIDFPFDDPPGGEGGVREPRRPRPSPPSLIARAPLPEPPVLVRDVSVPSPQEVTGTPA